MTGGIYVNARFSYAWTYGNTAPDVIDFTLESRAYGHAIEEQIRVSSSLIGYPNSTPAIIDTTLVWRVCAPDDFSAPIIDDYVLTVGDPLVEVDVNFI